MEPTLTLVQFMRVRVPLTELAPQGRGVLHYLKRLPESRVRQLHDRVMAVRERLQYSVAPSGGRVDGGTGATGAPDALQTTLMHLVDHFKSVRREQQKGTLPRQIMSSAPGVVLGSEEHQAQQSHLSNVSHSNPWQHYVCDPDPSSYNNWRDEAHLIPEAM
eukprot:6090580-Pleurochrysis_carterae.AAC.2